ncbi:hypothetical protein EES44_24285 [Streptomyces sp. ADI96-15]|uniref:hypothetical protein n=1 Tax=Streptomyces TaxID=1883 RepID=UPI000FAA124A|nr:MULTISPECIES: hypothetical protein [Streptomyces]MDH6189124.1 hypothetical protein [Streptomyces sp. CZ24]RPK58367.1 hypothetical protein EES44_24285 [Streptomyces sp. ADI96-15]
MSCPLIANADVIRVTRLDGCGRPVCGEENGFVFDCFATLGMNANVEEGEDVTYKAANGRQCGFKRGCPTFNGYDLELNFFSVSPELIEITTGNPVVYGFDGKPIGHDDCSIQCNSGFAIELWAEVLGEDICEAEGSGDGAWIYFLLPWVTNGQLGDLELGSEAVSLVLNGATRAGGGWGSGPYDVMPVDASGTPGRMLTPVGSNCHRRTFVTTVAPPEPVCEYTPVLCDASA